MTMFDKQNIRILYLRTSEKIRNFLLSRKSGEFLIFLFFVFVSFTFWLLQVLNDDYETELSVPLRMKNVPENVVMTSELPSHLKVGVKDRGTVLVNYLFGQTFFPVTIDFNDYMDKGSQVRIPSLTLNKRILGQLNQSTKLSSVKPDTLEFIYAKGKAKKVPVGLRGNINADRLHYISNITFSPDSVMVYAPQELLDTITAAYTESLDVEGILDTTRLSVNFVQVKGARFIPSDSEVTFYVDMYSEKVVEVPVQGLNFPDEQILRTFPSKVQVAFQVGLSRFKSVTAEDFMVVVDYLSLKDDKDDRCIPVLSQLPEGVKNVRISPKEVDYIIEQKVTFND